MILSLKLIDVTKIQKKTENLANFKDLFSKNE